MKETKDAVQKLVKEIARDLAENAANWMKERIHRVDSLTQAKHLLEKKAGIIEVPLCGKDECGHRMEEEIGARLLGTPEDTIEKIDGKCLICEDKAENIVRVALAY